MILNTPVSNLIEYQRLSTMSISTYVAGFYARLDNLTQLQMPDELKGHLLLNQANFGSSEKSMIVAVAKGSFKIAALVDSMTQLYGDRQGIPIEAHHLSLHRAKRASVIIARKRIMLKRIVGKGKRLKRN
jgi:hypothetical protein